MRLPVMSLMAILTAALWVGMPAQAQETARLTVSGQGSYATAPDMAIITLGVTTQARTASAALNENSAATASLLNEIARAGIEERDRQTSGLSLTPRWNNRASGNERPQITGYIATNQVTVTVRGLEELGQLLDRVVKSGANQFNGLSFGLQDDASARDFAREAAIEDALHRARIYAAAAGLELGPILSISETGAAGAPVGPNLREMAMSSAVPVAPGETRVTASVSVVFELKP